jgi:hypothetical protein
VGWLFRAEIGGTPVALDEESLNAATWEQLFLLANRGLPHDESWIAPIHCPTCRLAIAMIAVITAGLAESLDEAAILVGSMPAADLLSSFELASAR